MVDPHVHLRDWNDDNKETIYHGLKVAYECGINEVFDMPNTNPPLIDRETILDRLSDANKAIFELKKKDIYYHVYAGLTKDDNQIRNIIKVYNELFPMIVGLKLFAGHSTGNMGIIKEEDQKKVFNILKEENYKGVVAIHCEKEAFIDSSKFDISDFSSQSLARDRKAEIESIKDMISFAKESGFEGTIHVAHLSTKEGLQIIRKEKENNNSFNICCGVTPHHVLLNKEDANFLTFAKMNPPLREIEDNKSLMEGLLDGSIDFIESDHAPHTLADKKKGLSGIPGFSSTLLLINKLVDMKISKNRLKDLMGRNVYKIFDLNKEDANFSIKNVYKMKEISDKVAKEYPYDAFISYR